MSSSLANPRRVGRRGGALLHRTGTPAAASAAGLQTAGDSRKKGPAAAALDGACRMGRIYYEVTATILDVGIADEWVRWMTGEHIDRVLKAGAQSGRVVRLDSSSNTYLVQFEFESRHAFERYQTMHAPMLRQESANRFEPGQVSYARRSGEIIERA
jgi:hypothetical protein